MEQARKNLLEDIAVYAKTYPQESKTIHQFIQFIETNPQCFFRELTIGHLTASCWLINKPQNACLLLHHKKLNKWLQPGGHLDGKTAQETIIQEVAQETGLQRIEFLQKEIFDLDIHAIPSYKKTKAHWHYDIRYLLQSQTKKLKKNAESNAIYWVSFPQLKNYTQEKSILRMVKKALQKLNIFIKI